jgi:hypothetical protein
MGPEQYENVGKSQPVLAMINPMIFTRIHGAEHTAAGIEGSGGRGVAGGRARARVGIAWVSVAPSAAPSSGSRRWLP